MTKMSMNRIVKMVNNLSIITLVYVQTVIKLSLYYLINFNKLIASLKVSNDVLDVLKDTNKIIAEESSNSIEKLSEKKGEMLLEAISSDDDIAMDSEEDGLLVQYFFI